MKILHIGKNGNMERFTRMPEKIRKMQQVDLPIGLPADDYLRQAADADIIVADAIAVIPADLIDRMPHLRMICSEGVAYNQIDLEAADRNHVYVTNNQGMNADAVAEQTLLLMLGMLRSVVVNDRAVRCGRQIETKEAYMIHSDLYELSDCRVGLIGLGAIAASVVRLLHACHVPEIYYYKRNRLSAEEEQRLGVIYLEQDALLEHSDIVSLHLPVNSQTQNMAGDRFFPKMKDGSYFVNTSRGELVDSRALVRALESGKLRMAALDTLDHEPVKADHYLLQQKEEIKDKILFSPHIGGITASSFKRGYEMIWENVLRLAEGNPPKRVVNHPAAGRTIS